MSEQLPEISITKKFDQTSRYKNTDIYKNDDGKFYYGIWNVPKIEEQPDDILHTIKYGETLNLAGLADKYYTNKLLWWVIATANNILDPLTELVENQVIRIPNLSYVYSKILT